MRSSRVSFVVSLLLGIPLGVGLTLLAGLEHADEALAGGVAAINEVELAPSQIVSIDGPLLAV